MSRQDTTIPHGDSTATGPEDPRSGEGLSPFAEIVGESPLIHEVQATAKTVSGISATVLIQGERGTGKELLARTIHAIGDRRLCPFVSISYGALPGSVAAGDLFGREKGAIRGSQIRRRGKLEAAQGGTVFFDEIAELSPRTQGDLLRVLETKQFSRLGSNQTLKANFRIMCSTSHDLRLAVQEGKFREDLYYRINVFTIMLPPLRERRNDIPLLANHFLKRSRTSLKKDLQGISGEAMEILANHSWPGNVGELEEAIAQAATITQGPCLVPDDLRFLRKEGKLGAAGVAIEELSRERILQVLTANEWNVTRAAEILKVDRETLLSKVRKQSIERPITG